MKALLHVGTEILAIFHILLLKHVCFDETEFLVGLLLLCSESSVF